MHLDCDSLLECFCQCRERAEIFISALERCQLCVTLTAGGFVWGTPKVPDALGTWAQPCRCGLPAGIPSLHLLDFALCSQGSEGRVLALWLGGISVVGEEMR